LKEEVSYRFEEIPDSGWVRIAKNREVLSAVHEFLKFQISDHRTGDTLNVTKETVK